MSNRRAALALWVAAMALLAACTDPLVVAPVETASSPVRVERAPGFDAEVIRLGVLADLSGPSASEHARRIAGIEVLWSDVNAAGGLGGRFPVELIVRDHGGDVARAAEAYRELRENVVAFALVAGDDAIAAILPMAAEDAVQVVPGDRSLQRWGRSRVLASGTSNEVSMLGALQHLGEGPVWCGLVDSSRDGVRAAEALPIAAELSGLAAPIMLTVNVDHPVAEAVAVAVDQGCRVWIGAESDVADEALAALAAEMTVAMNGRLASLVDVPDGLSALVATDAPEWSESSPGMAELIAAIARRAPDVVADNLLREGYVSQLMLHEALETAIDLGDLRRAALDEVLGVWVPSDQGGLVASAHPFVDPPPTSVRIFEVNAEEGDALGWRFVVALNPGGIDELAARLP
jgi:ABC-type branched-subunit amino acid transport system substrate-binding protein